MSVVLAGREGVMPAALPRGAVALVLMLAVVLHLAAGAAVYWAASDAGTVADGQGGLTLGLGPAGAAPGALDAVEAEPVETLTPATNAAGEVGPPPVPDVSAVPLPAPTDGVDLADSADPVVAPVMARPVASRAVPDAATPEVVTATDPQEGLGVSRRPAARPQSVEEDGRRAARAAAARVEAERDTEDPAPDRAAAPGRQGRSGAAQGDSRGSGDGATGGGSPGARADFAARVAARLARAKQYPRSAQRARLEGTGIVWFRMNAAGQVTAARLTQGTGHPQLDRAIMDTLRRARLPAIPDSLGRAQMEFSVPISFTLR
jgi:protein TonB